MSSNKGNEKKAPAKPRKKKERGLFMRSVLDVLTCIGLAIGTFFLIVILIGCAGIPVLTLILSLKAADWGMSCWWFIVPGVILSFGDWVLVRWLTLLKKEANI